MATYILDDSPSLNDGERVERVREAISHLLGQDWKITTRGMGPRRMWIAVDATPDFAIGRGLFYPITSLSKVAPAGQRNYTAFTSNRAFQLSIGERRMAAGADDIVLLSNGTACQVEIGSTSVSSSIIVTGPALEAHLPDAPQLVGRRLPAGSEAAGLVHGTMRLAWTCSEAGRLAAAAPHLVRMLADQLAVSVLLDTGHAGDGEAEQCRARVKAFIDERLRQPHLTVGMAAAALGYSIRHVQYSFAAAGETASGHLRQKRLALAAAMLGSPGASDLSVTEIAYACGYSSSSHFTTEFRKAHGQSPSRFRDRAAGAAEA